MAAIMTTTLMGVFDGTMINIALPSMAQEMQVPASIAVWFANGYLLAAAMSLAIFAALAARVIAPFSGRSDNLYPDIAGLRAGEDARSAHRYARASGIGGAATLSIAPQSCDPYFPGDYLAAFWGCTLCSSPPAPLSGRYWVGRSFTPELAMAVCDKRGSRHPRLTAGGQSAAAGCGSKASALRHPGRHIVGAAAGVDDHGGEQPPRLLITPAVFAGRCSLR